ncbi:MAG: type II secretion system F family protein [Lachnospiraceae bacterium]|jgi:type IV pilus assembly protein PilC|nr:type II secretion system F family protein [Lachnospiraceae bacterium]
MPWYRYQAVNENGKKVKGRMQAADERNLHASLLTEGCYLIHARPEQKRRRNRSLKLRELSEFSRELGTLLQAGIPLAKVLDILSKEEGLKPDIRCIYQSVGNLLCQGVPLSKAMEMQGSVFPVMMIYMFRASEVSGNLGKTALSLGEYYSREHKLDSQIRSALIYPQILTLLLAVVTGLLIGFVLPQFEPLFSLVEELPLPTRILYGITGFLWEQWYLCIVTAAAVWIGGRIFWKTPRGRLWLDKKKMTIPFYGKLQKTIYTARFSRSLSSLYAAGIPIGASLEIARKTIGNTYMEKQFDHVIAMVENGSDLSAALEQTEGFLKKLTFAVRVGEEAGSLDTMLLSMADALEYDAGQALGRMVSCLEPAMILVMAVAVGFVMIAVMMPIYQSYQAIEMVSMASGRGLRG